MVRCQISTTGWGACRGEDLIVGVGLSENVDNGEGTAAVGEDICHLGDLAEGNSLLKIDFSSSLGYPPSF